ncbi:MAG: PAS domain-containing sensor histidine kinase [Leptolyngbya sp.]|nr:PAS domain-containing sensor histidine kinase [Candidatus Melainabacteria bacterium]
MDFSLTLSQRALILVAIPLTFELTIMFVLTDLLRQAEHESQRQRYSKSIVATVDTTQIHFYECLHNLISYYSSRSKNFRKKFVEVRREFEGDLYQLEALLAANASRKKQLESVSVARVDVLKALDGVFRRVEQPVDDMSFQLMVGYELNKDIQKVINRFADRMVLIAKNEKSQYSKDTVGEQESRRRIFEFITLGLVGNIAIAGLLMFHFNRTTTKRFKILRENSVRLSSGRPLYEPMKENDELGELDRRFHQMAATLLEASQRERAVLDNANDVICSLDSSLNFQAVNPVVQKLWGYTPEDVIGRRLLSMIDEEHRTIISEGMLGARSQNEEVRIEGRLRKSNGDLIDIVWSTRWSESEQAFFCVAHDVSERKAAENRVRESESLIRSLVANMPVGLITIDSEGIVQSTNPTIERLTDQPTDYLIGQDLNALFASLNTSDGLKQDTALEALLRLAGEKPLVTELNRRDGDYLPVEISVAPFGFGTGQLHLVMVVDITERTKADQLKRDFVAMVSHDLRTPLNSVRGFLQLASMGTYGELTEQGGQRLELAERNLERLLALVRDLLDIEKLDSGMMELNLRTNSAQELITASLDSVRDFAESEFVDLIVDIEDAQIIVDGERIIQVLVNLLSNAIKFSSPQHQVMVSGACEDSDYLFKVVDFGPGIAAQSRETVFERFKQVGIDSAKRKGSGLGLAICKAIVREHRGKIGVVSELGKGSEFWFRVPLRPVS